MGTYKANRRISLIAAVFFLTGCSWTKAEIGKEIAWQVTHTIDWRQSRTIAKSNEQEEIDYTPPVDDDRPDNPRSSSDEQYYEINPVLGRRPDVDRVDRYFIVGTIIHPIITHILPRKATILGEEFNPRDLWQNISVIISTGCVVNNYAIGIEADW